MSESDIHSQHAVSLKAMAASYRSFHTGREQDGIFMASGKHGSVRFEY
jgi:hypothetical protein